jgi:hypothetical protein
MNSISKIKEIIKACDDFTIWHRDHASYYLINHIIPTLFQIPEVKPKSRSPLYACVCGTPGFYQNATLIQFERFYINIGSSLDLNMKDIYSKLISVRQEFKSEGDIDNSTKTKYIMNCLFSAYHTRYDPNLAAKIVRTGKEIIQELYIALDAFYADTDVIATEKSIIDAKVIADSVLARNNLVIPYNLNTVDIRVDDNIKRTYRYNKEGWSINHD